MKMNQPGKNIWKNEWYLFIKIYQLFIYFIKFFLFVYDIIKFYEFSFYVF